MIFNNKYSLYWALLSFILIIFIFTWINSLVKNRFIIECFNPNSPEYSHNVSLPLTTTTTCQNFCGPPARCALTGQQCLSDIDCPGCQTLQKTNKKKSHSIPGDDDSGKLTFNQTPQYSPLTSDFGTKARIISSQKKLSPTPALYINNQWLGDFYKSEQEFNSQFKPPNSYLTPNYPQSYTLSGQFMTEGPLPSNSYIT